LVGGGFSPRLPDCVSGTTVDEVKQRLLSGEYYQEGCEADKIPPLQYGLLHSLLLRYVPHLFACGIQEEGLCRCAFGEIWVPDVKTYPHRSKLSGTASASTARVQSLTRMSIRLGYNVTHVISTLTLSHRFLRLISMNVGWRVNIQ